MQQPCKLQVTFTNISVHLIGQLGDEYGVQMGASVLLVFCRTLSAGSPPSTFLLPICLFGSFCLTSPGLSLFLAILNSIAISSV